MKRQRRIDSGSVGSSHDKVYIGQALRKVEADYYANRVTEKHKNPKSKEEINAARRNGLRKAKSDLDSVSVANIRWLKEQGGWKTKDIAIRYGLSYDRTRKLLEYATWAEVMPKEPTRLPD